MSGNGCSSCWHFLCLRQGRKPDARAESLRAAEIHDGGLSQSCADVLSLIKDDVRLQDSHLSSAIQ